VIIFINTIIHLEIILGYFDRVILWSGYIVGGLLWLSYFVLGCFDGAPNMPISSIYIAPLKHHSGTFI